MKINIDWEKFYKNINKVAPKEEIEKLIAEIDKENALIDELSIIDFSF